MSSSQHNIAPDWESFTSASSANLSSLSMAVIGSNWGDEGKGATTSLLCEYHSHLTRGIRFNGGPQSSHTVILPSRHRHAFSSVSSAYANGLDVGFTSEVMIEPLAFGKELRALVLEKGLLSKVFLNPSQLLITPYDMAVNQIKERSRRNTPGGAHGSCGFGIHETFVRNNDGLRLSVRDVYTSEGFTSHKDLSEWFDSVFRYHLAGLEGVELMDKQEVLKKFKKMGTEPSKNLFVSLWSEAFEFLFSSGVSVEKLVYAAGSQAIYEGGQGLLLDQDRHDYFPHVTHSSTGLENVINHATASERAIGEVFFVTRPYATRHGAGPMAGSSGADATPLEDNQSLYNIQDLTNIPNEFQGAIRLGCINWDRLRSRILGEVKAHRLEAPYATPVLALTCMDQVAYPEHAQFSLSYNRGRKKAEWILPSDFPRELAAFMGFPVALICGNKDLAALRKVVPSASGLITMYYPDGTCKERDIT